MKDGNTTTVLNKTASHWQLRLHDRSNNAHAAHSISPVTPRPLNHLLVMHQLL